MKNLILIMTAAVLVISCKKNEAVSAAESDAPNFVSDSVVVNDSVKIGDSLTLKAFNKVLVFPSLKEKTLLDSIYFFAPKLQDFSKNGITAYMNSDKSNLFESTKKESKDWISDIGYSQEWYDNRNMEIVSNKNDFLHIRYSGSSYMGGAHDNYYFSERVFDLKNSKRLLLSDITSADEKTLSDLLMKNIDKIPSGASDENGDVANKEMLLIDKIPVTGNFYFDDQNLYFHYSPYEIAAFAAGDITIPVSWKEIETTLKPDFKRRMNL